MDFSFSHLSHSVPAACFRSDSPASVVAVGLVHRSSVPFGAWWSDLIGSSCRTDSCRQRLYLPARYAVVLDFGDGLELI
jgi:hypothetical protein